MRLFSRLIMKLDRLASLRFLPALSAFSAVLLTVPGVLDVFSGLKEHRLMFYAVLAFTAAAELLVLAYPFRAAANHALSI